MKTNKATGARKSPLRALKDRVAKNFKSAGVRTTTRKMTKR